MEVIRILFVSLFIMIGFIGCSTTQVKKIENDTTKSFTKKNSERSISNLDFSGEDIVDDKFQIKNQNGILIVFEKNTEYVLSSKGINYKVHLSQSKDNLVVDTLLSNNLNTIEIFYRDYKFEKLRNKFKKDILKDFMKKNNYSRKDISFLELKFFAWIDNDTFEFLITGEFKNKIFEEKVRYDIIY